MDEKIVSGSTDLEASSSYCEMNSAQVIGHLKRTICESAGVRRQRHDLSVFENNGHDGNAFCCSNWENNVLTHTEMNRSQLHCSIRRGSLEDLLALNRHRVTHSMLPADKQNSSAELKKPTQFVCSHCGRLFKTSTTLNSHVMTHTGERPLACRVAGCSKRFTQHSTRSFHERTHSDDMPHICAVCGRRFKHATGVRVHMSVHTGCKPHQCSSCPMVFRRACDLRRHSRSHSGERPFSCSDCRKCFKTKKTLQRHILALHTDEVPWRCSVCNKGFKTSGNLRVHLRVHTGDRPYICAVCGSRFSYSSSLKSHMRAHSGHD